MTLQCGHKIVSNMELRKLKYTAILKMIVLTALLHIQTERDCELFGKPE